MRNFSNVMNKFLILFAVAAFTALLYTPLVSATSILGSADSFAVLGGSTVTNTGATNITGNLGVSPGSAVTGFPPGTVGGGTIHAGDAVAAQAQSDLITAYTGLAGMPVSGTLTGQDLWSVSITLRHWPEEFIVAILLSLPVWAD
jgi:hypothetical protein